MWVEHRNGHSHADVCEIGRELAVPFMHDYARRYNLPLDTNHIEDVQWIGAWYRGGLRAVAGIRSLNDAFPTWLYVYGLYGDGSKYQNVGVHAVSKALVELPFGLIGVVVLANLRMLRVCRRHGFALTPDPKSKDYLIVERPPKLDVLRSLHDGKRGWEACA